MAADLARLEQTLVELKALRKSEQPLYSVVPYKGKRGDSRKPIYLECTSTGLIFRSNKSIPSVCAETSPDDAESAHSHTTHFISNILAPPTLSNQPRLRPIRRRLELDPGEDLAQFHCDFEREQRESRTHPFSSAQRPLAFTAVELLNARKVLAHKNVLL